MNETELSKSILSTVNALPGVHLFRVNTGKRGRMNIGPSRGTPDLVGYCGKHFLGLEIKTAARLKDTTSATYLAQVAWRERAALHGASVFVVSSVREALAAIVSVRKC